MLTTAQRAIIIEICQSQEESFLRIMEGYVERIYNDLRDDGYQVSMLDIAEHVSKQVFEWASVKEDPDRLFELLDQDNISMIKHHLVQDHLGKAGVSGLWKKLNLYDNVNERSN